MTPSMTNIPKSYEIYLALYQGISGTEEWQNSYRQFSPDFFDLIVVDEDLCDGAADAGADRAGMAVDVGVVGLLVGIGPGEISETAGYRTCHRQCHQRRGAGCGTMGAAGGTAR